MRHFCKLFLGALALSFTGLLPSAAMASIDQAHHSLYAKAGILGAGAGFAYGINDSFTLRSDFTTMGSYSKSFTAGDVHYQGKLRHDTLSVFGDWFPFDNGFRLTTGFGLLDTRVKGSADSFKIKGHDLNFGRDDYFNAKAKYKAFAPYLGIGYGHNVAQRKSGSWGVNADLGVYFGRIDTSYSVGGPAYEQINALDPDLTRKTIDEQYGKFKDKAKDFELIPAVYVGVSYYF